MICSYVKNMPNAVDGLAEKLEELEDP